MIYHFYKSTNDAKVKLGINLDSRIQYDIAKIYKLGIGSFLHIFGAKKWHFYTSGY